MTAKLVGQVFEDVALPPSRKLLLARLAEAANKAGHGVWLSVSTMAHETGLTRRGVQKMLRDFEAAGILVRDAAAPTAGRGHAYTYTIDLAKAPKLMPASAEKANREAVKREPRSPLSAPEKANGETVKREPGSPLAVAPEKGEPGPPKRRTDGSPEPSEPTNQPTAPPYSPPPPGGTDLLCGTAATDHDGGDDDGPERQQPAKRGTRLAADWRPGEADLAVARQRGFAESEIAGHAECFRNYFVDGPGRLKSWVDWHRAWCNWLARNAPRSGRGLGRHDAGRDRRDARGVVAAARRYLDQG